MLITPVRPIGPDSFQRSESVQRSSPPRKTQETQDVSRTVVEQAVKIQNKDVIALTSGLDDNLETAANTVSAVFERVREQITNTLGLRGEDNGDAVQLLPPENATGEEVVAFFSPENTAKRIVSFATSFIQPFLESRNAEPNEENVSEFVGLITGAIEEGFAQAKEILGPQVLGEPGEETEVGTNIERTFELVLEGIKEFQQTFAERSSTEPVSSDEEVSVEEAIIGSADVDTEPVIQPTDTSAIQEAFDSEPINLEPVTNPFALDDAAVTEQVNPDEKTEVI